MHPDVEELRPKLKEVLYDCAVDIRATKAALYMFDPAVRRYELVAEYGFRSAVRQWAGLNDPMVDRCSRGRSPFFVNSLSAEPKLSELLFHTSSERLMGVPLFSRGQLVGFIDMRDKAGKQPFEQSDIDKAQTIAGKILTLFTAKNIWNQRFLTLSDVPLERAPASVPLSPVAPGAPPTLFLSPQGLPASAPALRPPNVVEPSVGPASAPPLVDPNNAAALSLQRLNPIIAHGRAAARAILVPSTPDFIAEAELPVIRESLKGILLLPGVIVAAFSATAQPAPLQEIAAGAPMADEAIAALQSKLHAWLTRRGESLGNARTNVETPLGSTAAPISGSQLQKVFTAQVIAGSLRGLYLTAVFTENPDRATHELLGVLLSHLQMSIEQSLAHSTSSLVRARIAIKLLEPEGTQYPDLRRHSNEVMARSERFAEFLSLSPADVEKVRLTAMLHDVGLRLLDYERLYRKRGITAEEFALLREHSSVGAAIVEPFLGVEIARAVLCHHERIDGGGYPHELRGDDIPLVSRIVQICDAYVAITDPSTYQVVESHEDALAAISRGAGSQFDADLARRFVELMREPARVQAPARPSTINR